MALTPEDAEKAISGAEQFAAKCRREGAEPKYIKWPQGWLSERRFEDYARSTTAASEDRPEPNWWRANPAAVRKVTSETWWRGKVKAFANGHWPVETLGPPPGDPGCLLPADLSAEMAKLYDENGAKRQ
jgi:hypothetical protein